jgi:hypothetical protein
VQQIQDKLARKQQLNSDESLIMKEWNRQLDLSAKVEEEKRAKRYKADMDTAKGLEDQVRMRIVLNFTSLTPILYAPFL